MSATHQHDDASATPHLLGAQCGVSDAMHAISSYLRIGARARARATISRATAAAAAAPSAQTVTLSSAASARVATIPAPAVRSAVALTLARDACVSATERAAPAEQRGGSPSLPRPRGRGACLCYECS